MTVTIPQLRDAIMRVTGLAIIRGIVNLSLEQIQAIINVLPEVTGDFEVCSICRQDLEAIGFNASNVSDEQMKTLASKMSDDYGDQLRDISMESLAISLKIPKKKGKK